MDGQSYNVLTIARYIINRCNKENISISNLKLQKLLYYIQATFLVIKNEKCFNEQIQAWDFGPVVPEAYREFKIYGSNNIPLIEKYIRLNLDNDKIFESVDFDDSVINDLDKDYINQTIEHFGVLSATELVEKTHNEDPWKKNYKSSIKGKEIPCECIFKYFKSRISVGD